MGATVGLPTPMTDGHEGLWCAHVVWGRARCRMSKWSVKDISEQNEDCLSSLNGAEGHGLVADCCLRPYLRVHPATILSSPRMVRHRQGLEENFVSPTPWDVGAPNYDTIRTILSYQATVPSFSLLSSGIWTINLSFFRVHKAVPGVGKPCGHYGIVVPRIFGLSAAGVMCVCRRRLREEHTPASPYTERNRPPSLQCRENAGALQG
jgi:hypothetical protein